MRAGAGPQTVQNKSATMSKQALLYLRLGSNLVIQSDWVSTLERRTLKSNRTAAPSSCLSIGFSQNRCPSFRIMLY
ncbi:hypothetical protein BQ8482_20123 [Mesorhizobium delmotii]|uniref:Uncharacterized protein n=1 Tax=Mesorhizobium delmotii TaxID=1631247 RepID=A0A2P9AK34_9HYPH|nr:hypothetical protein BQ8482_20123 [Mesorhizobium delmotii]